MFYFLGLFLLLYVFSRITGMMDWAKEPGTKGWLLAVGVCIVSAFLVTALWLKSEFDDSGDIDKLRGEINGVNNNVTDAKGGLSVRLTEIETDMKWVKELVKSQQAKEEDYKDLYDQATPEDQKKILKAKPLFDIEYARLLKKHGSIDAVKNELPALKQKLLNLDNEKERSTPDNGSKPNAPERSIKKLPLPPK